MLIKRSGLGIVFLVRLARKVKRVTYRFDSRENSQQFHHVPFLWYPINVRNTVKVRHENKLSARNMIEYTKSTRAQTHLRTGDVNAADDT